MPDTNQHRTIAAYLLLCAANSRHHRHKAFLQKGDARVLAMLQKRRAARHITQFMGQEYLFRTEEWSCTIDGQTIRGIAFLPDTSGKTPAVICAHGYGSTYVNVLDYGKALAAKGLAAYLPDFRGGGPGSMSDGSTTEMSVMTEAADLMAIVEAAAHWQNVDSRKIVLLGASQGGFASSVAAARIPNDVAALILLYPAYVLIDDMHEAFRSLSAVPDTLIYRNGIELGKKYFSDVWDYDPYAEIGSYKGPVLIIHGTNDEVVPLSYAKRAAQAYEYASLDVIEGGTHGFHGAALAQSIDDILAFLAAVHLIPSEEAK